MLLRDFLYLLGTLYGPRNCRSASPKKSQEDGLYSFFRNAKYDDQALELEGMKGMNISGNGAANFLNCMLSRFEREQSDIIHR